MGQARTFFARRVSGRSEAERLDPAPALRTLPAEEMEDLTLPGFCFQRVDHQRPRKVRERRRAL